MYYTSQELYEKCLSDECRVADVIQLLSVLPDDGCVLLSQHVLNRAKNKLYSPQNVQSFKYLTTLEKDMIKNIVAGIDFNTFMTTNPKRRIKN